MSTSTFEQSLVNALLPGTQDSQLEVQSLKATLKYVQKEEYVARKFIDRLYSDAYNDELPGSADYDAIYQRLVQLASEDDDDCWSTEREFDVEIRYTVTVKGTYTAKSEDEVQSHFQEFYPGLMANYGDLASGDIEYEVEDIEVSEA